MRATAFVFSGRPDPEWSIAADRAAEIAALLEAAPVTDAPAPAAPALGYRGVGLSSEACDVSWRIYAGRIVEERPGRAPVRRLDEDRRVERAVLATAPSGMLPTSWLDGLG